jgi:hypothetical protein
MKLMQRAQALRNEIDHYWPENVFLPSREWFKLATSPQDMMAVGEEAIKGPHRFTRSVYKFDPTLQESLMSTQLKGDIPSDLLKCLPEWTVYIDIDGGVYASLDYAPGADPIESLEPVPVDEGVLVPVSGHTTAGFELKILAGEDVSIIPLGPWSVEDAIGQVLSNAKKNSGSYNLDYALATRRMTHIAHRYLPLIMYICSDGVDYPDRDRPQNHRPTPVKTRRDGWKLFPAKRDRIWKLGERTGEAIRRGRSDSTATGRKGPAPHIRRAHWHTLRNGKVKFFPPIPVAQY